MRAKQLNKLFPPSLLYAKNYYSSLDSFIFFLFFNLCFPGLFCPPLAPQILWDTFFILIDFDSRVIDLMWSSCFSGVTDATFALAMAFPSPFFPWKWILSSPFQSFTSLPCFFYWSLYLLFQCFLFAPCSSDISHMVSQICHPVTTAATVIWQAFPSAPFAKLIAVVKVGSGGVIQFSSGASAWFFTVLSTCDNFITVGLWIWTCGRRNNVFSGRVYVRLSNSSGCLTFGWNLQE